MNLYLTVWKWISINILLLKFCLQCAASQETLSINNIYILLIGTSGSGKSSTINFLVDKDIAGVGDLDSTTSSIHEYSIQFSSPTWGNITFIDTPGFGDTRGLQYDARVLASLQEYMQNHTELSKRPPDLVLICHKFDDNRFNGEFSQFVKMLKALSLFSHLWYSNENLAILLTHFGDGRLATIKKQQYQQVIKNFTMLNELEIIFAENKAKLQELPEEVSNNDKNKRRISYQLPLQNISYPTNLCQWFNIPLSGNSIKLNMINSFCDLEFISVEETKTFELFNINDTKATSILQNLLKMNLKIDQTPVSLHLAKVFEEMSVNGEQFQSDTLVYVQKILNLNGIIELTDIPITNIKISALFRNLRNEEGIQKLLNTAFGMKYPELPDKTFVGFGLPANNLQIRTLKNSCIENLDILVSSSIGYKIPSPVTCSFLKTDRKPKIYHKIRSSDSSETSLVVEFRVIQCKLQDNVKLSNNFMETLSKLGKFNEEDNVSIFAWKQFIDKFGTNLVTESNLGGSFQLITSNTNESARSMLIDWESLSTAALLTSLRAKTDISNNFDLKIIGGNPALFTDDLVAFFKVNDIWVKSITDFPVNLNNAFHTKPTSSLLNGTNANLATEFIKATAFFENKSKSNYSFEQSLLNQLEEHKSELSNCLKQNEAKINEISKTLLTCQNETDTIFSQNYDLVNKLSTSENMLREVKLQVEKTNIEKSQINSENENNKVLLSNARQALTNEQSHSQSLNNLLVNCNSQVDTHQMSLNNCQVEKESCNRIQQQRNSGFQFRSITRYHRNHRQRWSNL